MRERICLFFCIALALNVNAVNAQSCDCPYPIIFLHGFTGNQDSYIDTYDDPNFVNIWGSQSDIFHAVLNAQASTNIWGPDNIAGNFDDDVLVDFVNENNNLAAGCVYSINLENWWNEDSNNPQLIQNTCDASSFSDSHSNESAIYKSGYALGKMIDKVLAANPDKDKVIVVGHSMGGLQIREYLQRDSGVWWPANLASGHGVKKAVTTATPHLGSNFFGNPWPANQDDVMRNGLPDINSEAARDLRYSYAFNPLDPFNCGFFGSCPGPYLFGGDESMPWGYWNQDVNCDGDDDQGDIITGINNSGGTYDNTSMALPTDLRYTWITSDIGTGGDLVVDITRQWIYDGSTPMPSDGVAHRLTDTLLTDVNHLAVDDDVNVVVRGLDESDYAKWAWKLKVDHTADYVGVPQLRSLDVPDGPRTDDPDWFQFSLPAGINKDICITITALPSNNMQLDFFNNPGDFDPMSTSGISSYTIASGSGTQTFTIPNADLTLGGDNYVRIISESVDPTTWHDAYKISLTTKTPPCPINYAGINKLAGMQLQDAIFETNGLLESTQIIDASAVVNYDSAISVTMEPGFEVKLGVLFNAYIDGCGSPVNREDSSN